MAANVELNIKSREELKNSVGVDIHTQRPRTPNTPYTVITDEQIENLRKNPNSLFCHCKHEFDDRKCWHPRYGYRIKREICVIKLESSTHLILERKLSIILDQIMIIRERELIFIGGYLVNQVLLRGKISNAKKRRVKIPATQRPMTTLPGYNMMKYGRPGHGYYVQKYPGLL